MELIDLATQAARLRGVGIEVRVAVPLTKRFAADLAIRANNRTVALIALAGSTPASWARYHAYMQESVPVFAVPPAELTHFAAAWTTQNLRHLDRWRVPSRGCATPPI